MDEKTKYPVKALIVEDFDVNLEIVVDMLEMLGIEADTATNGREALRAIQEKSYDLILMDIRMPVMDGYKATEEIRKLTITQPLIIALTASISLNERILFQERGFDDCMVKPIDLTELEKVLDKWGAFTDLATRKDKRCLH